MNLASWIILAVVFLLAVTAVCYVYRHRKVSGGCGKDCSECMACGNCGKYKNE